jgi:anti-anti-sigma regulatory factor
MTPNWMTLKIERDSDGDDNTIIRLIGRVESGVLEDLKTQIEGHGPKIRLDLEEVTLVDVQVVRFLGQCEARGIKLLRCLPYIREWILREREAAK